MKRGFIIGLCVIIAGLLLELATGPVVWNLLAWPANIVALGLFVAGIIGLGTLYSKSEIIRWLSSYQAAVPTMIYAVLLTMIMGLTRQMCWWGINYLPSAKASSVHTYGASK